MEEADALADRAGIMATRMLALGTTDYLRKKHGDAYYVHLVTRTAPYTPSEEMERIRSWVRENFPGANIEARTYHGQMRFSVPARTQFRVSDDVGLTATQDVIDRARSSSSPASFSNRSGVSALFNLLETHKHELDLEYYSVSQTTLDQVFLNIITKHNIEEENASPVNARPRKKGWMSRFGHAMTLTRRHNTSAPTATNS